MEKKLLILTQKVDKDDPILGFFHSWISRLADHVGFITVICLEKGRHELPGNVRVFSLGKEAGRSRLKYIARLYSHVVQERGNYDSVFVHMNQEYVLLAGLLWKVMRKKILMWRNHSYGNILTRIAVALSDVVMCVSDKSYTARFDKAILMPAGIDTAVFRRNIAVSAIPRSILCVGRISPVKHIETLIRAAEIMWTRGDAFVVSIVGDPSEGSESYYKKVRTEAMPLEKNGVIVFYDAVPPSKMPELYNSHEIVINLTDTGSFDKTVIEAMACERVVVVSNKSFSSLFPSRIAAMLTFSETDHKDLSDKLSSLLEQDREWLANAGVMLRKVAVERHSLSELISRLGEII